MSASVGDLAMIRKISVPSGDLCEGEVEEQRCVCDGAQQSRHVVVQEGRTVDLSVCSKQSKTV